jgi:hypothetical protein
VLFSAFNLCAGTAALQQAMRMQDGEESVRWASRRLRAIAQIGVVVLPLLCLAGTALAWKLEGTAAHGLAAPVILLPIAWLIVMGVFFAIVDFAEDGVFDFGRGPGSKA